MSENVPDLARSRRLVPRLEWVARSGSTNDDLVALARDAEAWPDLSVLVTDHQSAGRGRLGREWVAPAGSALAISVVLRPDGGEEEAQWSPESYGWIPLLAGLAMTIAVREQGVDVDLKWPNDILATGRTGRAGKLCGVLAELLPGAAGAAPAGVVVGAGINLLLTEEQLPVDTASSLALAGLANPDRDTVLSAYLGELTHWYERLRAAGGDADRCGLRAAVTAVCGTLGREVRVELPGGVVRRGRAHAVDAAGHLVVATNLGDFTVAAGDVTHLRY